MSKTNDPSPPGLLYGEDICELPSSVNYFGDEPIVLLEESHEAIPDGEYEAILNKYGRRSIEEYIECLIPAHGWALEDLIVECVRRRWLRFVAWLFSLTPWDLRLFPTRIVKKGVVPIPNETDLMMSHRAKESLIGRKAKKALESEQNTKNGFQGGFHLRDPRSMSEEHRQALKNWEPPASVLQDLIVPSSLLTAEEADETDVDEAVQSVSRSDAAKQGWATRRENAKRQKRNKKGSA